MVAGPLHAISRIISFFYPFLCIIVVLFGKNNYQWFAFDFDKITTSKFNNFNDGMDYIFTTIPYFPGIMTLLYLFLVILVLIYGILSYRSFILYTITKYGQDGLYGYAVNQKDRNQVKKKIIHYYNWSKNKYIIEAMIIDFIVAELELYSVVGKDIANIILSYINTKYDDPSSDHYKWIQNTRGRYQQAKIKPSREAT